MAPASAQTGVAGVQNLVRSVALNPFTPRTDRRALLWFPRQHRTALPPAQIWHARKLLAGPETTIKEVAARQK